MWSFIDLITKEFRIWEFRRCSSSRYFDFRKSLSNLWVTVFVPCAASTVLETVVSSSTPSASRTTVLVSWRTRSDFAPQQNNSRTFGHYTVNVATKQHHTLHIHNMPPECSWDRSMPISLGQRILAGTHRLFGCLVALARLSKARPTMGTTAASYLLYRCCLFQAQCFVSGASDQLCFFSP